MLWPLALVAVLGLTACTGGGEDDATDDVATLGADGSSGDGSSDDEDDPGGGGEGGRPIDPEFQDAMVEFAACMREQGIDFPDPQVDGDGGVIIAGPSNDSSGAGGEPAGPPSDAQIEEMEAAHEECEHILEEVEGSFPELDPAQEQEMRDQALEFAECMREHGIDFPDPEFGEGGRTQIAIGGGEDGEGGIDPRDDDFQAAAEECGGDGGFIGVPGASASEGDG